MASRFVLECVSRDTGDTIRKVYKADSKEAAIQQAANEGWIVGSVSEEQPDSSPVSEPLLSGVVVDRIRKVEHVALPSDVIGMVALFFVVVGAICLFVAFANADNPLADSDTGWYFGFAAGSAFVASLQLWLFNRAIRSICLCILSLHSKQSD